MRRAVYKLYRLFSTSRFWAQRRLTPAGWLVVLGLTITAGMATDAEQSVGYQCFALLACLALVAMACAPFFRIRFTAERVLPRFGTVGRPLHYRITVTSASARRQEGLFLFDNLRDPRPSYDEFLRATQSTRRRRTFRVTRSQPPPRVVAPKPQAAPALLPRREADVDFQITPLQRGVLHFGSVSLARPDPFMLFRAFSSVPLPAAITILPKRYPLPSLSLPGAIRYQQGGVAFASAIGESEEFVALRDYRQGDPLRRIYWRSWAKVGRPVVKEYQDEFFVRHALILDTFTEPDNHEMFEEAVSIAASFACTLDTQDSLLDLLFVGPAAYCFTVGRGLAHADQMLEILASVQTCSTKPFQALHQVVIEHSAAVSGCICIFLAWDAPRRKLVQTLETLGVPVLVLVLRDPAERPQPAETGADRIEVSSPVHEIPLGKIAESLACL